MYCGIKAIDNQTTGLKKGNVTAIAGVSGGFKTTMLMNMAIGYKDAGFQIFFLSLESDAMTVQSRIISQISGVPYRKFTNGDMTHADLMQITDNKDKVLGNIGVCGCNYRTTLKHLVNHLKVRASLRKFDILFVDGLDLLEKGVEDKTPNVYEDAVCKLRILGNDFGFATVVSTQIRSEAFLKARTGSPVVGQDALALPPNVASSLDDIFLLYPQNNEIDVYAAKLRYAETGNEPRFLQVNPDTGVIKDLEKKAFTPPAEAKDGATIGKAPGLNDMTPKKRPGFKYSGGYETTFGGAVIPNFKHK